MESDPKASNSSSREVIKSLLRRRCLARRSPPRWPAWSKGREFVGMPLLPLHEIRANALHVVAMLCRNLAANSMYLVNDRVLVHSCCLTGRPSKPSSCARRSAAAFLSPREAYSHTTSEQHSSNNLAPSDHHDLVSSCCPKRIGSLLGRAVK